LTTCLVVAAVSPALRIPPTYILYFQSREDYT
jgi:hypothetical protein